MLKQETFSRELRIVVNVLYCDGCSARGWPEPQPSFTWKDVKQSHPWEIEPQTPALPTGWIACKGIDKGFYDAATYCPECFAKVEEFLKRR